MELTQEKGRETLAPCSQGEHNFIPIGDAQKREDAVETVVGTMAFCQRCSNTVFLVVAIQSRITVMPPIKA